MANYRTRKIIPIALTLIIIAIAIAALVSLARAVFFSGTPATPVVSQTEVVKEALLSSDPEHNIIVTVRGPLVADEAFRSYKFQVNANVRELTTYKGYLEQPLNKISLGNNVTAYEQFVFSLYRANLIKGTELPDDQNELRGICATGTVYVFEVYAHDKDVKRLWTSTCAGSKGSLDASVSQLMALYRTQIPGSDELIANIPK